MIDNSLTLLADFGEKIEVKMARGANGCRRLCRPTPAVIVSKFSFIFLGQGGGRCSALFEAS